MEMRPYSLEPRAEKGQALVELAIFGSMMIVVLGAMVNFAMNADLEQQTTMKAVRDAMWSGARAKIDGVPDNESYMQLNDGIIADPTNPFSIGGSIAATGNWSNPTRSFRIGQVAKTDRELPRTIIKINGKAINCPSADVFDPLTSQFKDPKTGQVVPVGRALQGCTTAGFRDVTRIGGFKKEKGNNGDIYVNNTDTIRPIDKYDLIYGVGGTSRASHTRCNGDDYCSRNLRLIDPNEGEIVSRDQAVFFCRQMFDPATCKSQCLLTKKDPEDEKAITNCEKVCSQDMGAQNIPKYCDPSNPDGSDPKSYLSKDFAALFPTRLDQDIGLQLGNSTRIHQLDTTIRKVENSSGTATVSQINRWVEGKGGAAFTYRDKGGVETAIGVRKPLPVPSATSRNVTNAPPVIWENPHD